MHSLILIAVTAALLLVAECASAQALREARPLLRAKKSPVKAVPASEPLGTPIVVEESLQQYLTRLVLEEVPSEYENTKKWGGTKRVVGGLDWELDGLKVETRRQWKEVNHGSWSRYKLKLIDPENTFEIRLENLRDLGSGVVAFDFIGVAKLDCSGRVAQWQRGVQLVSLGGEADAKVRLVAHVEVSTKLDTSTFPPDILAEPKVTSAELILQEFELRRLGHADGVLVKQLGEVVEEGLQDYLVEQREKLVEKMNQQLEKKKGKLRLPLSKLTTSNWGEWFTEYFKKQP